MFQNFKKGPFSEKISDFYSILYFDKSFLRIFVLSTPIHFLFELVKEFYKNNKIRNF